MSSREAAEFALHQARDRAERNGMKVDARGTGDARDLAVAGSGAPASLVVVTDGSGAIRALSADVEAWFGTPFDTVQGESFLRFVHPDDVDAARRWFRAQLRADATAEQLVARLRLPVRDAPAEPTAEISATNLLGEGPRPGVVLQFRPVAAREDAMTLPLRAMFEHAAVAQALVPIDGSGLVPNDAFCRLFGRTRAELQVMPMAELIHPDDREQYLADRAVLFAGTEDRVAQTRRYVRGDGSMFFGRVHMGLAQSDDGRVTYVLGTIADITPQVEAMAELTRSEARFRALVDASPDIVTVLYSDGSWTVSEEGPRQLGYAREEVPEGGVFSLIHPDDVERASQAFAEVVKGDRTAREPVEIRLRATDGTYLDFECAGQNLGAQSAVGGVVVTARNITVRKQTEHALHEVQARVQAVFDRSPLAITMIDLHTSLIFEANPAACELFDRTREELIGLDPQTLIHPDDQWRARRATERQLAVGAGRVEFRVQRADGREVWALASATFVETDDPYVLVLQFDISARKRLEARLEHEAATDPLTGLLNRQGLLERLVAVQRRVEASRLAVLYIDLDHFKAVNDSAGHDAGDAVLAEIAARLRDATRGDDLVSRIGGDEFLVVLGDISRQNAARIARRIVDRVSAPIEYRGVEHRVGASVGVAFAVPDEPPSFIIERADGAAYQAKRSGRGRVVTARKPRI